MTMLAVSAKQQPQNYQRPTPTDKPNCGCPITVYTHHRTCKSVAEPGTLSKQVEGPRPVCPADRRRRQGLYPVLAEDLGAARRHGKLVQRRSYCTRSDPRMPDPKWRRRRMHLHDLVRKREPGILSKDPGILSKGPVAFTRPPGSFKRTPGSV